MQERNWKREKSKTQKIKNKNRSSEVYPRERFIYIFSFLLYSNLFYTMSPNGYFLVYQSKIVGIEAGFSSLSHTLESLDFPRFVAF